jgi:hypothetical protein
MRAANAFVPWLPPMKEHKLVAGVFDDRRAEVHSILGGVMQVILGGEGETTHNKSLRPVVAAIDREMSRVAGGALNPTGPGVGKLLESWAELVELLALGPVPEMRECSVCKHMGMRAATRCGFCWTALSPLAHGRNEQAAG